MFITYITTLFCDHPLLLHKKPFQTSFTSVVANKDSNRTRANVTKAFSLPAKIFYLNLLTRIYCCRAVGKNMQALPEAIQPNVCIVKLELKLTLNCW